LLYLIQLSFFFSTVQNRGESVHFPEFGESFHVLREMRPIGLYSFLTLGSITCLISDFRREVGENCALLGYYAECSGIFLPTFRDNLSVPKIR